MERYKEIERSIIKKYRKDIWSKFIKAVKEYELIKENDKDVSQLTNKLKTLGEDLEEVSTINEGLFTEKDLNSIRMYGKQISAYAEKPMIKWQGQTVITEKLTGQLYLNMAKAVDHGAKKLKDFSQETDRAYKGYDKMSDISNTNEDLAESAEEAYQSFSGFLGVFQRIGDIKSFINIASGIGQLTSAISTFKNIGNIFSNDDLSTGEKILQITTALTTTFAMASNGAMLVAKNLGTSTEALKKFAAQ